VAIGLDHDTRDTPSARSDLCASPYGVAVCPGNGRRIDRGTVMGHQSAGIHYGACRHVLIFMLSVRTLDM
jgi:hypothetical protein